MEVAKQMVRAAQNLARDVDRLRFAPPVSHVYNPLLYAWAPHQAYLENFATSSREVIFLGMNPGPFGMVQTGVPFGEINAVRSWLKIHGPVGKPDMEHPKRPVSGYDCPRCEISGQRLWGLFQERFKTPERFFKSHFVVNYCPLAFLEETGRNFTPDKLPAGERAALYEVCDRHLRRVVTALQPKWIIGIGDFAAGRAEAAADITTSRWGKILHPSPASPLANKGWAKLATEQLVKLGVWR
jgi:single-strand selective monofunctional uracil DNA glycosylase